MIQLLPTETFNIPIMFLVAGILILVGALGVMLITRLRDDFPDLDAVFDALTPWFYKAILAGEQIAYEGLQDADQVLTGLQKAEIANRLYDLLPSVIYVKGKAIPIALIKTLIPRDVFAAWIKSLYDTAHEFIKDHQIYLRDHMAS